MSYALKYFTEWKDLKGNIRRLEIHELDFGGSASKVIAGERPITITWNTLGASADKLIMGSEGIIELAQTASGQYHDIAKAAERTILVKHLIGGNVIWQGYLIPLSYSESDNIQTQIITFSATEDFKHLETKDFDIEDDRITWIEAFQECIKDIGFDIRIYIADDLVSQNMTIDTADDNPANQLEIPTVALNEKNKLEVLEILLSRKSLRLMQTYDAGNSEHCWFLMQHHVGLHATPRFWRYNADATYNNTFTRILSYELNKTTFWGLRGRGTIFHPRYSKVTMEYECGMVNLIKDHDFSEWVDWDEPAVWELEFPPLPGGANPNGWDVRREWGDNTEGKHSIQLTRKPFTPGWPVVAARHSPIVKQEREFRFAPLDKIALKILIDAKHQWLPPHDVEEGHKGVFGIRVKVNGWYLQRDRDTGETSWLDPEDMVGQADDFVFLDIPGPWTEVEINTPKIILPPVATPGEKDKIVFELRGAGLFINMDGGEEGDDPNFIGRSFVRYDNIRVLPTVIEGGEDDPEDPQNIEAIISQATLNNDTVEVLDLGSVPIGDGPTEYHTNRLTVDNEEDPNTEYWSRRGEDEFGQLWNLGDIQCVLRIKPLSEPSAILDGQIHGLVFPQNILAYKGQRYLMNSFSLDSKYLINDGEYQELGDHTPPFTVPPPGERPGDRWRGSRVPAWDRKFRGLFNQGAREHQARALAILDEHLEEDETYDELKIRFIDEEST